MINKKSTTILLTVFTIVTQYYVSSVYASGDHGHGSDEMITYCTTECTANNADDPCTDDKSQQPYCVSPNFITAISNFGYDNTDANKVPSGGFIGCSESICHSACMNVNMNSTMEIVKDSTTGIKTFCFPTRSSEMFMKKDEAEMSAISRGCSGSHMMNSMYMNGAMHGDCSKSYSEMGIPFGKDPDSSSSYFGLHFSVGTLTALSIILFSLGL